MEKLKQGFWKRQFTGEPTRGQTRFDVILGILLPIFCLIADPIVFCGYDSIVARYRWLAYLFIGMEIVVLVLWLVLRRRLAGSAAFFAGPLLAGGLFALAVGLGILPISLVGILVLIGLLGLTPFFTAIVYFRNGVRALARSRGHGGLFARTAVLVAGVLFIGTPTLLVLHGWYRNSLPRFVHEAGTGLSSPTRGGNWIWQDCR